MVVHQESKRSKAASYVPATNNLLANPRRVQRWDKKVLVVGAGCAGLGAAWHLNRAGVDVTLFEELDKLGGHANTINADGVDIDTGFMVYNTLNYPNLCAFFEELGVEGESTTMGFSVSMNEGRLEWCADSFAGLLASPSNATNPQFYLMMKDIVRFNKAANAMLQLPESDPVKRMTVREFIAHHRLSNAFRDLYFIPMTGAIWSASAEDMLNFPAATLFTFLNNHLLLQVSSHITWMTPKQRSAEYVRKVAAELEGKYFVNKKITAFTRAQNSEGQWTISLQDEAQKDWVFDEVVFACHPDQALKILGEAATENEKKWLSRFHYAPNATYVHCDESLMPKSKAAWTSWNYIGTTDAAAAAAANQKPVFVTYWINKLQHLQHPRPVFVSLNPHTPPAPEKTFNKINYAHPQFSPDSVAAQRGVASIQGEAQTYFCGAWMGYGFHEDGFRSGIEVATAISGVPAPWVQRYGQYQMVPAQKAVLHQAKDVSLIAKSISAFSRPATSLFEVICQQQVISFLRQGFEKGKLTVRLPDGSQAIVQGKYAGEDVTLVVKNRWFFVRLALEADLGLARSYIAGEWEILNTGPYSDGLTRFFQLLIDNMPTGKTKTSGGLDAAAMITAWVGSALNNLYFKIAMDNTIANSRSHIHAHYDLSNELFETFLDKETMMYSSALFETTINPRTNSLEFKGTLAEAQLRKIDALLERLEPLTPQHTLLDVGFGWGGICIRAAQKYGCRVTGITLSVEQKAFAEQRVRDKGLEHLIEFELVDYRVFARRGRTFDRIVSCEMIEAVGNNHLGSFFECMEELLATDGIFVMQAITMPDSRYPVYVKSADFINTIIFPGGCCPSLSALLSAMATHSKMHLDSCTNTNLHYAETLRRWRKRFNENLPRVLEVGFDDTFLRLWNLYFCYCEAGFENEVINLQILTFSRPGNPNMLRARAVKGSTIGYAV